jgi:hypothetical protein
MTEPALCYCGSKSWERSGETNRYICAICKRPLWQQIETAPKDGSAILIWPAKSAFSRKDDEFFSYVVRWNDLEQGWIEASGEEYDTFLPTHWMPLPEPPKESIK